MALRPKILEYIVKLLSIKEKSELPLVIMRREIDGQSPIDTACDKNQLRSLSILLDILTKYQNDHSFNYLIDRNLVFFIEKGIDLSEYFESELPKIQILSENYP